MPRVIDPARLPKHFDAPAAEARWDAEWARRGVYTYDPARPRAETFVVDTPPPTVSGSPHMGHVFSYTHADVIVRTRDAFGEQRRAIAVLRDFPEEPVWCDDFFCFRLMSFARSS